ncbi:helix-turn-helix transcriptional regulator [Rhodococcus sp. NPDC127530]|uniref:helix-turn-helix transcriptional regulator n=1 Tax=unclassified Rhodococcus (in: high G+C Gram-positive bacteria) TaxID=192944 RepID=UPI00363564B8
MSDRRPLATDTEFCEFTGLTKGQSAQLRWQGNGPKFVKVTGRQIRYRWEDVEAWIDSRTRTRTDDRSGAA